MSITTWQQFAQARSTRKAYLLRWEPCRVVSGWTQHQTYTNCYGVLWQGERFSDKRVSRVIEDDTQLSQAASLSACNSTAGSWYLDSAAQKLYAHCTDHADPDTHLMQVYFYVYLSSRGMVFDDIFYFPLIAEIPRIAMSASRDIFGGMELSSGQIVCLNGRADRFGGLGPWDEPLLSWQTYRKTCTIYFGGEELPLSEYRTLKGVISTGRKSNEELVLQFADAGELLRSEISAGVFTTDTYPNLEDNAKGRPIPIGIGENYNCRATKINKLNWTFKICDPGPYGIKQIIACREDGVDITSNLTDISLADATFRLSAYAGGVITVDYKGCKDQNGNLIELPGDVALLLLQHYGKVDSSLIDTAAFAQLNTDCPYRLARHLERPTTLAALLDELALSVGAVLGQKRTGELVMERFSIPASSDPNIKTYSELTMADVREYIETSNLYSSLRLGWRRNNCVQTNAQAQLGGWDYDARWTVRENTTARRLYQNRNTLEFISWLVDEADAASVADRLITVYGVPWHVIEFATGVVPLETDVGDTIRIERNRTPLEDDERYFKIIGFTEDHQAKEITVKAMRPLTA